MSDIKTMLISDRFFNLEDQKSAQACFYRQYKYMGLMENFKTENFRNFPDYTEEVLNNLLSMSDNHLYIAIPTLNSWRASGHPQTYDGEN